MNALMTPGSRAATLEWMYESMLHRQGLPNRITMSDSGTYWKDLRPCGSSTNEFGISIVLNVGADDKEYDSTTRHRASVSASWDL